MLLLLPAELIFSVLQTVLYFYLPLAGRAALINPKGLCSFWIARTKFKAFRGVLMSVWDETNCLAVMVCLLQKLCPKLVDSLFLSFILSD